MNMKTQIEIHFPETDEGTTFTGDITESQRVGLLNFMAKITRLNLSGRTVPPQEEVGNFNITLDESAKGNATTAYFNRWLKVTEEEAKDVANEKERRLVEEVLKYLFEDTTLDNVAGVTRAGYETMLRELISGEASVMQEKILKSAGLTAAYALKAGLVKIVTESEYLHRKYEGLSELAGRAIVNLHTTINSLNEETLQKK